MSHARKQKNTKSGASLHESDSQFRKELRIICNSRAFTQESSSSASSSNEKISDSRQIVFDQDFYNRIEAFLDQEGLYLVDPKDALIGIRKFSKDDGEMKLGGGSKSQTYSPTRLINCSPIESKLFQRRMSLSLAPSKLIQRLCNSKVPKPLDLKTSNLSFQNMKAIEEVESPALSRNNSECAASTPKRVVDPKQISRLLKDLSAECKSRGSSANPQVHSASPSAELGPQRRSTDEIVPLNGSLRLKTASSLILPSENSGRVSRRSKFFDNFNKKNYADTDSFVFSEKRYAGQEDDCPPMA